ncbi:MAG TPA: electron transfer flavoprotein subunit beta/FixA family protein [Chloroflexota bacterium]|nr:electron transfer flavoprotein subunit beta/FixA family protein [Chloroflexota bacterium]
MRIVVTVKQVPDPDVPAGSFQIDPGGRRALAPPGVAPIMNGYDANALEAALRLKEAHGGTVTALGLGAAAHGARDTLKRAIAMGADVAVLVDGPSDELDSWATARALAAAIRRIGSEGEPIDLVLCGRQASDTDAGQVPLGIAALLDLPAVAPVQKVEWRDGLALVERMTEDGYQLLEVRPPALLAVSSEVGEPRYPPLRGVMMAGRAQIPAWTPAELGEPDLAPGRVLRRLRVEQRDARVEMIQSESGAEAGRLLADKLREAKLI